MLRKYWFVYALYWQEGLAQRATFVMERFRALVVMTSLYYLWTALLRHQASFAGYTRPQILTYVFGMSLLRSIVFATRTDEVAMEINQGRLSGYLLKPVDFFTYTLSRDLAEKSINFLSCLCEIAGLYALFHVTLAWPSHMLSWIFFAIASMLALLMNYLINFAIGCWGFWTSESSGPRFLVALILEFTAGSFFPLDILPLHIQHLLRWLPSPYLIFFPLNILLEKSNARLIVEGFCFQIMWIIILGLIARLVWSRGVDIYGAEGA